MLLESHHFNVKVPIFLVLAITLMSAIAQGADISLEKTLSRNVITNDDIVTVKITLMNNLNKEINGELIDWYPKFAGVEGYTEKRDYVSMSPTLHWNITLKPKEKREITYYMNFSSIPITLNDENYTIPGAVFHYGEYTYCLKDTNIFITGLSVPERGCNYNFVCEPERGENFGNCPQDCSSSGKDNYCNPIENVVCDPDCGPGQDPDCEVEVETSVTIAATSSSSTIPLATTLPSEKPEDNGGYLIYLIALFIILPTAFLIYRKTKTGEIKKEKKELEVTEWVKKNLRDGEDPEALKEILREGGYDPKIVDELTKKLYG